ncbi:D-ribose pyranase [Enterococcus sp. LJL98]
MKKHGILNSHIAKVLADLGHTDQLTIGDLGLPIPKNVPKIDLALQVGTPSFLEVLETIVKEMVIEKIVLAEEIKVHNPSQLEKIKKLLPGIEIQFITHEAFKRQTNHSQCVVRTGEATPYANVILSSGVLF